MSYHSCTCGLHVFARVLLRRTTVFVFAMTDYSPTSHPDDRDKLISGSQFSYSHLHTFHDNKPPQPSLHPNGKMRLGKSNSSPSTPVFELPPLVGAPHDKPRNHQATPDGSGIPAVCHGALDNESPAVLSAPSPLMRRRLKYMVRQCSDSELLKDRPKSTLGRLKLAPASGTASPVPHPPDQSPRSLPSSESNSPRIHRKPPALNPSWAGPSRISRSLDASPMVARRVRSGVRRNSGGRDQSPSSRPTSPPSDQRRPRPFSFGSYSDVVQFVSSSNEPPQMLSASTRSPGSPFVSKRTVGVRGAVILPSSRPDTPANDAVSIHESKKSHHRSSSSGDRSEAQDNEETGVALEDLGDAEESILPRRRLRRDSGSRNSTGPSLIDNNRNFKKSQYVAAAPTGTSDYPYYPYEDHVADHLVDDDGGYPSNLYDIQERRESILSIEAVQEIARRFANGGDNASADSGSNENGDEEDEKDKSSNDGNPERQPTPEYRKKPLSTDARVSSWLKGIQDPTERVPTTLQERILPDII